MSAFYCLSESLSIRIKAGLPELGLGDEGSLSSA